MANFKPNDKEIQAFLNSAQVRKPLLQAAEKAKGIAEGLAQDFRVTGDYAGSFHVSDETVQFEGRYAGPRAAAQLTNTSDHAAAVEWGNAHSQKAHRVLGRTLAALEGDA